MSNNEVKANKEQLEAISHGEGPLLIIAGAGTGKTSVITQRIAHLILDKGVRTDGILALTFTEKAATEMEERVDQVLPYGYVDLWISTFHSFCEKVLRQHGLDIGLPTDFKLINQTDQWMLVRQHLEKFDLDYYRPRGNPTKFIHSLLSHFSKAKDEEIYPEDYMQYAEKIAEGIKEGDEPQDKLEAQRVVEVAKAYNTYQQLLLDENYLDFGDLINYSLKLFKERPNILKIFQDQFEYILVDEFQDTNYAQYELVKLLAGKKANITVVGDDDQSIYKFRGASISNIMQFKSDFRNTAQVVLTQNYRSHQEILDAAYDFIKQNNPNRLEEKEGINKRLIAFKGNEGLVQHLHFESIDDEVSGVVSHIINTKKAEKNLSWSDFAILVRSNDAATYFTNYLKKVDLPYNFLALRGLYNKPVIIDVINYFKLLDNYHESTALYRLLTTDYIDLAHHDLMQITKYANKKTLSLYEACKQLTEIFPLSEDTKKKVKFVLQLIEKHTEIAKQRSVVEVFIAFLQDTGILQQLLKEESLEDKLKMDYLQAFFKRVKNFEESNNDPSLKHFMEEFYLELESGEAGSLTRDDDMGSDAIQIMTIHTSKGLEFEHVYLPNMVDLRFPTTERKDPIEIPQALIKDVIPQGDMHLEEERRLMYVAMTRAKKGLYLTSAENYGGVRKKKLSRFIIELEEVHKPFEISEKQKGAEKELIPNKVTISTSSEYEPELPTRFSFSQLAAFSKCPYQYKLGFIYKIPNFGKAVFSYGRTLHKTLEDFYKELATNMVSGQVDLFSAIQNKSGKEKIGELISFDDLMRIYENSWIDDWYQSKAEKEEYYAQGRESLRVFYDGVKDQPPKVKYLEKHFSLKLDGTNGEVYTLRGVIDRVDEVDGKWHIIDYKTGSSKDKLDWDAKMQLLIYQVAAIELFNAEVEKLTYYYLDDNKELSFLGKEAEIEKLKKELVETIENIKSSNFSATPGWQCQFCDFKDICEYKQL